MVHPLKAENPIDFNPIPPHPFLSMYCVVEGLYVLVGRPEADIRYLGIPALCTETRQELNLKFINEFQ